jgi:hypothetical protein
MYLKESWNSTKSVLQWATQCFQNIKTMVLGAEPFWVYVEKQWMPKLNMWLTDNRHLLHAKQDTKAAIESYHGNMKAVLRASNSYLVGPCVDKLIHKLIQDDIMKYMYNHYLKESDFITNKKAEHLVSNLQSQKIPDICILLPMQ